MPLPPNAMGNTNLGEVYNDVLEFIRHKQTGVYAPVYTWRETISVCESVLEYLRADSAATKIPIHVYSIQYLFYIMKV